MNEHFRVTEKAIILFCVRCPTLSSLTRTHTRFNIAEHCIEWQGPWKGQIIAIICGDQLHWFINVGTLPSVFALNYQRSTAVLNCLIACVIWYPKGQIIVHCFEPNRTKLRKENKRYFAIDSFGLKIQFNATDDHS